MAKSRSHPLPDLKVIHLGSDAAQIANAVIVAVGKAARIDLIEHRVLPPIASRSPAKKKIAEPNL